MSLSGGLPRIGNDQSNNGFIIDREMVNFLKFLSRIDSCEHKIQTSRVGSLRQSICLSITTTPSLQNHALMAGPFDLPLPVHRLCVSVICVYADSLIEVVNQLLIFIPSLLSKSIDVHSQADDYQKPCLINTILHTSPYSGFTYICRRV